MIKHVVMIKLLDKDKKKELNIQTLKDKLDSLKNKIPEVKSLETGINISTRISAFDLVLISEFNSQEDLDKYIVHPAHQEVISFLKDIKDDIVVVDYEF